MRSAGGGGDGGGDGGARMHAEGILVAKVLDFADEGHYYVAPIGNKKRRRVLVALLVPSCLY